MRTKLIILAFSPLAVLAFLILFGFQNNSPLGSLVGDIAIVFPLALLAFSRDSGFSSRCRRFLTLALASFLLLLPALALHFAPKSAANVPPGISLLPTSNSRIPAEHSIYLHGLAVAEDVLIMKSAAKGTLPYCAEEGNDLAEPPHKFTDANGNGLDFSKTGDDVLHFQDDKGGFADVHWDGQQFVLTASKSAGGTPSASVPSRSTEFAVKVSDLLLILTPMFAWLMVTGFAFQRKKEIGEPSPALALSAIAQVVGMVVLIFAMLTAPETNDEVSGGLLVMIMLFVIACSGAGLAILGWNLMRLQLDTLVPPGE